MDIKHSKFAFSFSFFLVMLLAICQFSSCWFILKSIAFQKLVIGKKNLNSSRGLNDSKTGSGI